MNKRKAECNHEKKLLLKKQWKLAEKGLVPPLLIYADLMATGDARVIEAAEIIYDNYLTRLIVEDR